VASGVEDGPGALGTAKGVDCGHGVPCGRGVGLGDGVTDGVLAGEGDWVDGVVGRSEGDSGFCAPRDPAKHVSPASTVRRRTGTFGFDVFPID
jgi:hypothetical protein